MRNSLVEKVPFAKSCLDCGYFTVYTEEKVSENGFVSGVEIHAEMLNSMREDVRNPEGKDDTTLFMRWTYDPSDVHCLRGVWSGRTREGKVIVEAARKRLCQTFYPYNVGPPDQTVESHRSRTNRRWLIFGGLMGPFLAVATGVIVADGFAGYTELAGWGIAAVGLAAFTILMNLVFVQR